MLTPKFNAAMARSHGSDSREPQDGLTRASSTCGVLDKGGLQARLDVDNFNLASNPYALLDMVVEVPAVM
ncbi:hypothetical protein B0H13DRAFT_2341525 [Mycena leptocephala]|nr:hypothetical protein B0H13DRAFT_2341525 [Mycena leptocephala]